MKPRIFTVLCIVILSVLLSTVIVGSVIDIRDREIEAAAQTELPEKKLKMLMQPKNITVKNGGVATVTVKAVGEGLSYAWYIKNSAESAFTKSALFEGDSCRIEMNEASAGRQVYCVITDKHGDSITTNIVTVNMSNEIKIVEQPKSTVAEEGETAAVTVKAAGDGLVYKWYYKNANSSSFEQTKSFSGETYKVEMDKSRAGRQICCVITDQYGSSVTTNVVTLHMGYVAKIVEQPKNTMVSKGEIATVSVEASGDDLTYEWYYKNAGDTSFQKTDSSAEKTYKTKMSKSRQDRQIYCVVTDKYGNSVVTDVVTLAMGNVAKIIEQPASLIAEEGENAAVTVKASGDGLSYAWYARNAGEYFYRKSDSFTGNTYRIKMNEARAGRQVYCVVSDRYGNTVKTDAVTMDMKMQNAYPFVSDKLSWDKISAFPIASETMSVEERRKLCVDFFRFSKSFAWTPSEDLLFVRSMKGAQDSLRKGSLYGGLPYVHMGSGNVYRIMDCMDTRTGVLDVTQMAEAPQIFGNQCSLGSYWAWGRVVNSAQFDFTYNMVQARGFLPLGEYTYDDSIRDYRYGISTRNICTDNGEQTMYESYACLQSADGLVKYCETGGHVIMSSANAVVVRNEDGTINGDKSYIYIIDQSQKWSPLKQSNGDAYFVKNNIDVQKTFSMLFSGNYIPFTFAEFLGTDPVDVLEYQFSHTGETISAAELGNATVKSNYGMSDVYAHIKDKNGSVVYTAVRRMEFANTLETSLLKAIDKKRVSAYSNGSYTVEVQAQFANGERHILYTGVLKD